jgi:hypothetical protein
MKPLPPIPPNNSFVLSVDDLSKFENEQHVSNIAKVPGGSIS